MCVCVYTVNDYSVRELVVVSLKREYVALLIYIYIYIYNTVNDYSVREQ